MAEVKVYPVIERVAKNAWIKSMDEYKKMYNKSIEDPDTFWAEQAKEHLDWFSPFTATKQGSFENGDIAWFPTGKINVSYNCLDRHLADKGDQTCIIWEGDDVKEVKRLTYNEVFQETCRLANLLKSVGLKKGDNVAIYMPNCPEAAIAMLACARIGVVHSVIFGGFSADALTSRIRDANCKVVITADGAMRGGKAIYLKKVVDEALLKCHCVSKVFVLKRMNFQLEDWEPERDVWLREAMNTQRPYCPCEWLDSEDTLFLLYTSGSTGSPKGVLHTQAGYLLMVTMTFKYVFDYHPGDIYACVADVGWITGHSYIVYGPLSNGATTVIFESVPTYPDPGRYWDLVARHKITQFYTAPTAIRTLMKFGADPVKKYDRSSLRILGSVGEPINPEAWRWYHDVVGEGKCAVVDTFWQTESGAHILTPLPGATPTKPGSATFPFFGIKLEILSTEGKVQHGNGVEGVLAISTPWPSIARTVYNNHDRYLQTYMSSYKGYYFTGDGATRDQDGYYWISGRVDDVINVSGHRLGTAEVESALVNHAACAEAAVVGYPHDIKGQGIFVYCILRVGFEESHDLIQELKTEVRRHIGGFATPDVVMICSGLPKTRSGKIMRRILRKIAAKEASPESLGDISTLADPAVVEELIQKVNIVLK